MLPVAYFDRLTHAMGLRTDRRGAERRIAIRIPACQRADVYPVSAGTLAKPARLRARDISASGIGLLVPKGLDAAPTSIVCLQPPGGDERFLLLCRTKRLTKLDGNWAALGLSFEGLLGPGQLIGAGADIASLWWIDVAGDRIPDDPGLLGA